MHLPSILFPLLAAAIVGPPVPVAEAYPNPRRGVPEWFDRNIVLSTPWVKRLRNSGPMLREFNLKLAEDRVKLNSLMNSIHPPAGSNAKLDQLIDETNQLLKIENQNLPNIDLTMKRVDNFDATQSRLRSLARGKVKRDAIYAGSGSAQTSTQLVRKRREIDYDKEYSKIVNDHAKKISEIYAGNASPFSVISEIASANMSLMTNVQSLANRIRYNDE